MVPEEKWKYTDFEVGSSLGKVCIIYVHFQEEDGIVWVIHPPWHMCKSHPNFVVVVWMQISIVA